MRANTDTRVFRNVTSAIYRFQPLKTTERFNIHTVNERVHIVSSLPFTGQASLILNMDLQDGHLSTIQWIHALFQNADALTAE